MKDLALAGGVALVVVLGYELLRGRKTQAASAPPPATTASSGTSLGAAIVTQAGTVVDDAMKLIFG